MARHCGKDKCPHFGLLNNKFHCFFTDNKFVFSKNFPQKFCPIAGGEKFDVELDYRTLARVNPHPNWEKLCVRKEIERKLNHDPAQ